MHKIITFNSNAAASIIHGYDNDRDNKLVKH